MSNKYDSKKKIHKKRVANGDEMRPTKINKKVIQKGDSKKWFRKVIQKSDSQRLFTKMIHKNDSQKWFTKIIHKTDSQ